MIAKPLERNYRADVGWFLPLQMISIISNQYQIGPLLVYTFHGQITLHRIGVLSSASEHTRERKWHQHIKRGLNTCFCYNYSKEAVAQSVSSLCLVNLLKTMVVCSSPDDDSFLFSFVLFFLLPSAASLAEIIQNSHFLSQENFFPTPKTLGRRHSKYTMCCAIDTIEAVRKVQNAALILKPEAGI